jgi:hypothetical protein
MQQQLLYRNVQWFPGGLVFQAHRLSYHSSLGLRLIKKRSRVIQESPFESAVGGRHAAAWAALGESQHTRKGVVLGVEG